MQSKSRLDKSAGDLRFRSPASANGPLGLQIGHPQEWPSGREESYKSMVGCGNVFFPLQCVCGCSCVFSFDFKIGQFMLNTLPSVEQVLAHGTFSIFHQIPCARAHQPNTNNRKERA